MVLLGYPHILGTGSATANMLNTSDKKHDSME